MPRLAQFFVFTLLLALLSGCAAPAPAPTLAPTFSPISVLPTATATPTYETSPTPDIPRPTISSNLSPQNNAAMVLENGAWVDKNAAGQLTATWDSAKSEWTYTMENITTAYGIAGWPEKLPIELTRENHPECFDRAPHDES
jgi:hypothetical protein